MSVLLIAAAVFRAVGGGMTVSLPLWVVALGLVLAWAVLVVCICSLVVGAREDELVRKLRERGNDG